jgi:HSP20 family protein
MTEEKNEVRNQTGAASTVESAVRRVFVPKVDIYETSDSIVIMADMPGTDADSLDVTMEKDILAIRGTAALPAGTGRRIVHAEHGAGEYRRNFRISDEVDREKIDATIRNGVLSLTLHKVEPFKARKISVKAA